MSAKTRVMLINPNPRQMSLVQPLVALFHALLDQNGIEMRFFDTTFYDMSRQYSNFDKKMEANLAVRPFSRSLAEKGVDFTTRHSDVYADFRAEVMAFQPHVVLASVLESTATFGRDLLRAIRDLGIPHVMGGVFPTYAPELAVSFPEVDAICVGEGEPVLVPLVERLRAGERIDDLPGIWVRQADGSITRNSLAPAVDMDQLPRFDARPFEDSRFYRAMAGSVYRMFPVETHRGCPLKCTFCNSPLQDAKYKEETGARFFRRKSIDVVMTDIKYFVEEMGAEYLFFWADNFFAYSRQQIDDFCRAYSEYKIPFFVQSYPTSLDEYKLAKLAQVGLSRIAMGVEHGNEEFRRTVINRSYSNQKAIDNVAMLRRYGIQYGCNNIVGFPDETPDLHMDTVHLNRALKANSASCSIFTPFHGTPLRRLAIEKGYLKDTETLAPPNLDDTVLEMPRFTREQITGKARTFNLYVHMPESRWPDIAQAEALTPDGDRIWNELRQECEEVYFTDPDQLPEPERPAMVEA